MKPITTWLQKQTVQRKLLLVILGTCCVSMLVAGVALFTFMTLALRSNFEQETRSLTRIVAANCTGPLAFKDRDAAGEILHSLETQEDIKGAAILLPNGRYFIATGVPIGATEIRQARDGGKWLGNSLFLQKQPIIAGGETIGALCLVSDFGPTHHRLFRSYLIVFGLIMVGAVLVGIILSRRARRIISDPIRELADSVDAASLNRARTTRASEIVGGEMERLTAAFNSMQERIEAGAKLEKEIAERRRAEQALRESEERFRSLFENAPIGLYRSSREGQFTMANPALLQMLGCDTFAELSNLDLEKDIYVEAGYRAHFKDYLERIGLVDETEVQWLRRDGKIIHVRESAKAIRDANGAMLYCEGCVEDITARKEAQAELQRLHRELLDASRAAGMAEVATGVLHNVGNVLNSVKVSATILHDQAGRSKLSSLQQAVRLLQDNLRQLTPFLTTDPKGKLLPEFLIKVVQHISDEHQRWHEELRQMQKNIEHMSVIVSMQQSYAKVSGAIEPLVAADLVEDAIRINEAALSRHRININRDYSDVPPVMVDQHKVLQILVNLIRNAKRALDDGPSEDKQLHLKIYKNGSGRVKIQIKDNGVGIEPANLTRIFSHGFTTRRDGHGFGLHSGALAANELGGILEAHSDGPGLGATFTLELPIAGAKN